MNIDELNKEIERINKNFKTIERVVNEDYTNFLANTPRIEHVCTPSFYQNDCDCSDYGKTYCRCGKEI